MAIAAMPLANDYHVTHQRCASQDQNELTHWGRGKMAVTLADDTFKCKFVNENILISIKVSLKFVPKGPMPALV